jgi:hypothetical protein
MTPRLIATIASTITGSSSASCDRYIDSRVGPLSEETRAAVAAHARRALPRLSLELALSLVACRRSATHRHFNI